MSLSGIEWGYCGSCGKEVPTVMAKGERLLEDHFEAGGFNVQGSEHHAARVNHGPKCEGSWKRPSPPPKNGDDETRRFQDIKAPVTADDAGRIVQADAHYHHVTDAAYRSVQRDIISTYFPEETERSRRWRSALDNGMIGILGGINVRQDGELPPGSVFVDGVDISQHITGVDVPADTRASHQRESAVNDLREMFQRLGSTPAARRGPRADHVVVDEMPHWLATSTHNEALERERAEVAALDARSDPHVAWGATPAEGRRELIRLGFNPDAPFTEMRCEPGEDISGFGVGLRPPNRYTLTQGQHSADVTGWIGIYHSVFEADGTLAEITVQRAGMSAVTRLEWRD
jgi:hypothetical protein